ncbi:hypothetical protein HYQ45_000501 [Verticillium longisporum]|uniref:Uncharacterized protein n=1 Tax=Verticillium longisporum TaxID=100787 RepID=A0A8I3AWZ7_VERLO|nr:hypothetical protein HYQ44_003047 [Verticillium longisporum]KAG7143250.1 hypothetical protein HYQ45_000501 [Verticillium longisporum]KAG7146502.1 hypothetical protein HYQ46_004701 [Verticillium longisporum]
MTVEVIGTTALFCRQETETTEFIEPSEHKGFGHAFEKTEGKVVPLGSTIEITTRTMRKPLEIRKVAPQVWTSLTLKLVRAYHNNGLFQPPPAVEDVAAAILRWEEENQKSLEKLAALTSQLVNVARELGGKIIVSYGDKGGKLVLGKDGANKLLPDNLYIHGDGTSDQHNGDDGRDNDGLGPGRC